jgi:hypothetical protein
MQDQRTCQPVDEDGQAGRGSFVLPLGSRERRSRTVVKSRGCLEDLPRTRANNSLAGSDRSWSVGGMNGRGVSMQSPGARSRPARAVERYVSRAELASIMAVSLATVDRMVAEGMPSVTWGRRTRRFRPSAVIAWAEDRGMA